MIVEVNSLSLRYQSAEGEVEALLGTSAVMRMDADTTAGKASYDRMLEKFRAGGAKVLLGTQMVTKGHDFPNVTFSGVLLADASLFMSDFRASERTFALLKCNDSSFRKCCRNTDRI